MARSILAIPPGQVASLTEIPCRRGGISGIRVVRPNLAVRAHNVEGYHGAVDDGGKKGDPKVHEEGHELGKQEEERQDGNGDIKVGETGYIPSIRVS